MVMVESCFIVISRRGAKPVPDLIREAQRPSIVNAF